MRSRNSYLVVVLIVVMLAALNGIAYGGQIKPQIFTGSVEIKAQVPVGFSSPVKVNLRYRGSKVYSFVLNTSNQYRITNKLPAGKYKTEVVKDSWYSSYTVTQPSEVYIKKDARESCNITISGNGTAANNVVTEKNDPGKVEQGKTDQGKTNQEGKTSTDSTNNSGEKNQPEDIYLFYPNEQGNEVQNNEENTAENNTENKDKTGETAADPLNKDTAKTNKEQQPKNENKSAEKPVENNKRLSDNFAVRIVKKNFLTIMMLIGVCIMTIIIKIKSKLEL